MKMLAPELSPATVFWSQIEKKIARHWRSPARPVVSQLPTNIGSPYLVDTLTMLHVHIHTDVTLVNFSSLKH